jgi:hypothetical protein
MRDQATLSGANAVSASGTVTYSVYSDASYSGDLANGASQTACGSETATVLSAGKPSVDVATSLRVESGGTVRARAEFEINLTVTDDGPKPETNIVARARQPERRSSGLTFTSTNGRHKLGVRRVRASNQGLRSRLRAAGSSVH